jgi:riboflavin kinase/FMN adenylyltransferase
VVDTPEIRVVSATFTLGGLPGANRGRAVTIGKFDGVHRGHQEVISELSRIAGENEVTVVTFDRHPRQLLDPDNCPEPLLSNEQKVDALKAAGAERVAVIPFTQDFADLSPDEFAKTVLVDGLGAAIVLVGKDFRYGHHGEGTLDTLRAEGERHGFSVHTVDDVVHTGGERISSTRIRALLTEGRAVEASELLGRPHSVRSRVVHGHQRGRLLGYPTANLGNPVEGFVPADGVYATLVALDGRDYPAATSIGLNPTFGDVEARMIEAHLFDLDQDLYDRLIEVKFVDYIRPMMQFDGAQALADQMDRDAIAIRERLS